VTAAVAEDRPRQFDPERVWGPLRRRRWLAVVAFLVPFTASLTLAIGLRNVYQSSAILLIERHQVPEAFVKSAVLGALETRLQTINQEILSRSNLETLITHFKLYPGIIMPFAVERMRRDIQVDLRSARSGGGGTATVAFAVAYRGTDRTTVAQVASAIASFYVEENLKVRQRQASAPANFLKAPLQQAKDQLDEYESRLRDFLQRHAGELPQDLSGNLATVGRLEPQLRLNRGDQIRALERREAARDALVEAEVAALRQASARKGPTPAERVVEKQAQLAQLRARYREQHPDIVAVKRDLAELEREVRNAPPTDAAKAQDAPPTDPHIIRLRQAVTEADQYLESLLAEEKSLRDESAAFRARLQNVSQRDEEFKQLTRNFETARDIYRGLATRYEEAELSSGIEQRQTGERFRLLDPAVPAESPSAPPRMLLLLIGLVASVGVAAAVVALAEALDPSFHTAEDLHAATSVPVVVTIPWLASPADALRRRWRRGVAIALTAIFVVGIAGASYVVARRSDILLVLLSRPRT
jgi:polysaccharide chain length determinant protein (PEP-CTERM system associated)